MKNLLKIFFGTDFRFLRSLAFVERLIVVYFIVSTVCLFVSACTDSYLFLIVSGINAMIALYLLHSVKDDLIDE